MLELFEFFFGRQVYFVGWLVGWLSLVGFFVCLVAYQNNLQSFN